jgi:hypothetical protein
MSNSLPYIYYRIINYKKIIKNINFDKNKDNYCVRFYKFDNKNILFRIGNNIIIKNKIGSGSTLGAIHLGNFKDRDRNRSNFVVKISPITRKSQFEIKITNIVTNAVLNKSIPHFLMTYDYGLCKLNSTMDSSFIKSNNNNNDNIKKTPIYYLKQSKKKYYVYINEFVNGDLQQFDLKNRISKKVNDNKIAQIYLALMFYYNETGYYHCDSHNRNFLYKTVKKGGYYHYRIFNKDYYLPNLGYIWIIWDYDNSKLLTDYMNYFDRVLVMGNDFININRFFIYDNSKNDMDIINNTLFTSSSTSLFDKKYDENLFNIFMEQILDCLCKLRYIYKKIDKSSVIINNKPFIINRISTVIAS